MLVRAGKHDGVIHCARQVESDVGLDRFLEVGGEQVNLLPFGEFAIAARELHKLVAVIIDGPCVSQQGQAPHWRVDHGRPKPFLSETDEHAPRWLVVVHLVLVIPRLSRDSHVQGGHPNAPMLRGLVATEVELISVEPDERVVGAVEQRKIDFEDARG